MFVNIKIYDNKIYFRTRNGKTVHQMGKLRRILLKRFPKKARHIVLHGELLIKHEGKILDRQTGNGILNSCLNGSADQEMADCAIIKIWDAVPMWAYKKHYFDVDYKDRFNRCRKLVKAVKHSAFRVIATKIVHSLKEAQAFYRAIRRKGGEGAIIKNFTLKWKYHTAVEAIKMKNVSEGEFRITGLNKGKRHTKWQEHVGSISCESECGKIRFSVGGLSDAEHLRPWGDWISDIGSVCSVEFDSIIQDKSRPGFYSLYLPRNLVLRPDRTYADTYKQVKERMKK